MGIPNKSVQPLFGLPDTLPSLALQILCLAINHL